MLFACYDCREVTTLANHRATEPKFRTSVLFDAQLRELILALSERENRSFGNAVNQLLSEALVARGLLPPQKHQ